MRDKFKTRSSTLIKPCVYSVGWISVSASTESIKYIPDIRRVVNQGTEQLNVMKSKIWSNYSAKCMILSVFGNLPPLLMDDCMDAGGRATPGAVAERAGVRRI